MKKLHIAILLILSSAASASAQQRGSVKGTVVDNDTSAPLPGAVVEFTSTADTTRKHYTTAAYGGAIDMKSIQYGDYRMSVSFLGYENLKQEVTIGRQSQNLGTLRMRQEARRIEEVFVEGQAMRTSVHGDTLAYNASSYKTTADADAEGLLSKMPGITISGGEVTAQGEAVEKIFVDGKEFFGEDVNTTLKTIPAEMIARVEVYDKKSDQAEFTGIDDGQGFKAINLVTNMKNGAFGKTYGVWGIKDKYSFGTNTNVFTEKHRFSVIGMANNVNQQNFSYEDILGAISGGGGGASRGGGGGPGQWRQMNNFMVPTLDGISRAQSVGVNYSGNWGKKIEATASYFFNNSKNENDRRTEREYTDGRPWDYDAWRDSETRNHEHRFRSRIDYNINDNHSLMLRTSASWQNYRSEQVGMGEIFDTGNPASPLFVRSDSTSYDSKIWGYSIRNFLIYRVKLGKPGRTLTLDVGGQVSDNDSKSRTYTLSRVGGNPDSEIDQKTIVDTKSYEVEGSVIYTEPLSDRAQLTARYEIEYSHSDADRSAYLWDGLDYLFEPDYSNVYNSGYLTQQVGPGFNYSTEETKFNFGISYQRSTLANKYDFPSTYDQDRSFDNVVYRGRFEHSFDQSTSLRIFTRSRTTNPSIAQLRQAADFSNKQFITAGNPNLDPAYDHHLFTRFIKSDVEKGTTFMAMGGFVIRSNYIGDYVITDPTSPGLPAGIALEDGAQYVSYRNMSGFWSVNGGLSYGFPLSWLRSNLNTGVWASYSETPGMINDNKTMLAQQNYSANLSLGSNISEKIDFTAGYDFGYMVADNSVSRNSKNEYFTQQASLSFKLVLPWSFTFSGSLIYLQQKGISDDYNDETTACNLYIGKKLFRDKRGEIIFGVNDLLNEKSAFRRSVTTQYVENIYNNALGRYFSLQLVYNLRTFGAPGVKDGDSLRPHGGGGFHPRH